MSSALFFSERAASFVFISRISDLPFLKISLCYRTPLRDGWLASLLLDESQQRMDI
jgi:hypothetical protein